MIQRTICMLKQNVVLTCCILSVGNCLILCNASTWFWVDDCLTISWCFKACSCNWICEFCNAAAVTEADWRFICCWPGELWMLLNVRDAFWFCCCVDCPTPLGLSKMAAGLLVTVHTGAAILCCTEECMILPSRVFWGEVIGGDVDADTGTVRDGSEDTSFCEVMRTGDFWVTCGSVVELVRNVFDRGCWWFCWSFGCCCGCGGCWDVCSWCDCEIYSSVLGKLRKSNETSSSISKGSSASWDRRVSSAKKLLFLENNSLSQFVIKSVKKKKITFNIGFNV